MQMHLQLRSLNLFLLFSIGFALFVGSAHAQNQTVKKTIEIETFGGGIGDWFANNGVWEIGLASEGPVDTTNLVAGTVLDGLYPQEANSRLISPGIQLPSDTSLGNDKIRLQFDHWYNFNSSDFGVVEISTDGVSWEPISDGGPFMGNSSGWQPVLVPDLTTYAGEEIFLSFLFVSTDQSVDDGWFIDNIEVFQEEDPISNGMDSFGDPVFGWTVENGNWETGVPLGEDLPEHAVGGIAATVLNGFYTKLGISRYISPRIELFDNDAANQYLKLSFLHRFDFADVDSGYVQLQIDDGPWSQIGTSFKGSSSGWSKYVIPDLNVPVSAETGVRIAFVLSTSTEEGAETVTTSDGWQVDEFVLSRHDGAASIALIEADTVSLIGPEDPSPTFEWFSDNGIWQRGLPTSGPGAARTGEEVAATVLDGFYPNGATSRFVSPPLNVPATPFGLSFWHWFEFAPTDVGVVQISINEDAWISISNPFTNSSGVWTRFRIPNVPAALGDVDLKAGDIIRIGFLFSSEASGTTQAGWYLDDIEIEDASLSVGTDKDPFALPERVTLEQNYPNPFNPSTSIAFSLAAPQYVSLRVYDLLGREVAVLVDEVRPAGPHNVTWHADDTASGVYLYRLQTNQAVQTRQMMLIK